MNITRKVVWHFWRQVRFFISRLVNVKFQQNKNYFHTNLIEFWFMRNVIAHITSAKNFCCITWCVNPSEIHLILTFGNGKIYSKWRLLLRVEVVFLGSLFGAKSGRRWSLKTWRNHLSILIQPQLNQSALSYNPWRH